MARRYLAIEKIRLGDRLKIEEAVQPETLLLQIPPLVLQPLIENALKHGISQMLEGGVLRLTIEVDKRRLKIVVENPVDSDAPGLPGTGTGLINLRSRLLAQYNGAARLVAGPTGAGYKAEIVLPLPPGDALLEATDGQD